MLTPAQYKALKAWPESGGYVCGVSYATCKCLVRAGLFIRIPYSNRYKKVSPACDDAIREYEAAQRIDNPCVGCGSQRCYPAYCDSLKEYKAKKLSG